MKFLLAAALLGLLLPAAAPAAPVGEAHRITSEPTAALRDAMHRDQVRITVWYPAVSGVEASPVVIGPPAQPLFDIGGTAMDAPFAAGPARRPVILLSHGFGGSARMMGWFGIAMARGGYVVIAVDHPGSTAIDAMTVPGATLWWDRAEDLRAALNAMLGDPVIGPHLDPSRIGVAGFSAGGFTALVAAGARVDPAHLAGFCRTHPDDGVCRPQREFQVTPAEREKALALAGVAAEQKHATDDHAIPGLRAAFVMAPGLVQALEPASLPRMHSPVFILLGDADPVVPPATNGLVAARMIPGAELKQLPGVGHYDFLSACTEAGRAALAVCRTTVPQAGTHSQAVTLADAFFARAFAGSP
jgi:predicted dienelactone hydrolase